MPAYVITEMRVLDEHEIERYRSLAAESVARYGGRYLARSAAITAVEGNADPERIMTVLEFPSMERAREWYGSPEYAEALAVAAKALDRRLLLVDGVK